MAITHRTFSNFQLNDELEDIDYLTNKLNSFHSSKEDDGFQLNSVIKMDNFTGNLGNNVKIISGIVFDEYLRTSQRIKRTEQNDTEIPDYTIISDPYVDIRAGAFWILNDGMLVLKTKGDRTFISNLIYKAIGVEVNAINIDIERVAEDYKDNWIGGIIDREGNWEKGTLHGENLRADDCIGREFVACMKNQVGGYTEYFGGSTKFRVTKEGVVTVYSNLDEDIETFLRFVRNEIQDYFV